MKTLLEKLNEIEGITVYHASDDIYHMKNSDFHLDKMDDFALFGAAMYFSSSPSFNHFQFGKYLGRFKIKVEEPCMDMNQQIDFNTFNDLLKRFNRLAKLKKPFEMEYEEGIQIGEIFDRIAEKYNWDYNKYFPSIIKSYGCNSFKYYMGYYTDFITELGDYGICYGIYDNKNIEFVDITN